MVFLTRFHDVTMAQIIYCPKDVQLICLSATVANPEELASWITQVGAQFLHFYSCCLCTLSVGYQLHLIG
jgi:superfamily II RNA helicase